MNFFKNILRSFYDFSFYKEVRNSWKGWGMGYTTAVIAILVVIGMIAASFIVDKAIFSKRENGNPSRFEDGLRQIANQWPDSVIQNDTFSTTAPMPHIIGLKFDELDHNEAFPAITIDTTGMTTYDNMTTPILLTSKDLIFEKDDNSSGDKTEIRSLKDLLKGAEQPLVLNSAKMNDYTTQIVAFIDENMWKFYLGFGGFTSIFIIPFVLIVRIMLLIPLGVAGLLIAKIMKRNLDYDSSVRVIAIVLLPLTIIEVFALLVFTSGVSVWIKVLVSLGVLTALLKTEPKKA